MGSDLNGEHVKAVVAGRDAELKRLLESNPGCAVGYRLKPGQVFHDPIAFPFGRHGDTIEWEYHVIELVDGKLPVGHADFLYVTLKDDGYVR